MTSSNIKSWWHSFQLSVEWWKFGYHSVFSWQLPPFWVAMLFSYLLVGFHIWQLVIHGSWDSVTLGNKECCPWQHNFYSQFPGNFSTEYLILHSFMLHSWTYSSVSLFLQVVFGERIRPSLYNVSNSFYLRSCLDDFMFIWAIHQLISGYIY